MIIETKYSVGDTVWTPSVTSTPAKRDCPDCLGKKKWETTSPAGRVYEFTCPRCSDGYKSDRDLDLDLSYSVSVAGTQSLTIALVRGSSDRSDVSYMCQETGVGSGTVHRELDLYQTEDEALAAAEISATRCNADYPEFVKKTLGRVDLSDYQLSDATLKSDRDALTTTKIKYDYILQDLHGCADIDQVRAEIDKFWADQ